MPEPLIFNAFTMNLVSHVVHGLWAHPDARTTRYTELDEWVDLARKFEAGGFDAVFWADLLGVQDDYQGSPDTSIREAIQVPNGDPAVLVSAMAHATERLGFVFTGSILQEPPFTFARKVSTLDHLTKGRIGWNVVTSSLDAAARNYGLDKIPSHAERYAWADEYVDVVFKLWEGSWEDDAVLADRERRVYADPAKVHPINHVGERYRVAGPHLAEPSLQRTPVLFQAGTSGVGRDFAARNAEVVFIHAFDPGGARVATDDIRARAARAGRAQGDVKFIQGATFVLGSTETEAQRHNRELDEYLSDEGMMSHMSSLLGMDLSTIDLDASIGDPEAITSVQGLVRSLVENTTDKSKTFREMLTLISTTRFVGTPEQIADEIERWAQAGVDGFNVHAVLSPGTYFDFAEHAAPELRRRGLMRPEPLPGTLREKLFPGRGPRLPATHPASRFRLGATVGR